MTANTLVKFIAPATLVAGLALPLGMATPVLASTSTPATCSVVADGSTNTTGATNSRFTMNGLTVSGKLNVTGDANCKVTVTLATWQAPNGGKGQPYSEQKLYQHTTATFGPGKHTISTTLPDCFYQVDLLHGTNATAPDGSPVYPTGWLMGSLHGGTKVCGGQGGGTPVPTPTPTPTVVPDPTPVTPSVLPDTGSAQSTLLGLLAMSGAGYAYWRSRRNARA